MKINIEYLKRDLRRYHIVFLHAGVVLGDVRSQICETTDLIVEASAYSASDETWSARRGEGDRGKILIIDAVEGLRHPVQQGLNVLRAKVHDEVDNGLQVLLISRVAVNAYPISPGSDLLNDAKQHYVSLLEQESSEGQSQACDNRLPEELLIVCLSELGDGTIELLGRLLWEEGRSPNETLEALDGRSLAALRGAQLVGFEGTAIKWSERVNWKSLRFAVAEAIAGKVDPGGNIGQTFADLWVMERSIRNAIRHALKQKYGEHWRNNCLPRGLQGAVLQRAQVDAFPEARTIKDLRDPLEWLSTTELLELRVTGELGDLGMASFLWASLARDILRVRNRVAHMRMLDEADATLAQKWRRVVVGRLEGS